MPPLACPRRPASARPPAARRRPCSVRGGAPVRRAGAGRAAGFALDRGERPGGGARSAARLDGLPLALELAARPGAGARRRTSSLARLDDRFRLLTGGRRTAPPAPADPAGRPWTGATPSWRGRAGPLPPPGRLRRGLHPGGGRGGRAPAARAGPRRGRPGLPAGWSTSRWWWPRPPGGDGRYRLLEDGAPGGLARLRAAGERGPCWAPRPVGLAPGPQGGPGLGGTDFRGGRPGPGRADHAGSPAWTRSRTTSGAPWPGWGARRLRRASRLHLAGRLWRLLAGRGPGSAEGRRPPGARPPAGGAGGPTAARGAGPGGRPATGATGRATSPPRCLAGGGPGPGRVGRSARGRRPVRTGRVLILYRDYRRPPGRARAACRRGGARPATGPAPGRPDAPGLRPAPAAATPRGGGRGAGVPGRAALAGEPWRLANALSLAGQTALARRDECHGRGVLSGRAWPWPSRRGTLAGAACPVAAGESGPLAGGAAPPRPPTLRGRAGPRPRPRERLPGRHPRLDRPGPGLRAPSPRGAARAGPGRRPFSRRPAPWRPPAGARTREPPCWAWAGWPWRPATTRER